MRSRERAMGVAIVVGDGRHPATFSLTWDDGAGMNTDVSRTARVPVGTAKIVCER